MANTKITDLTADTSPTADDLLVTVNNPAGTPANRKVTIGDVLKIVHPVGCIYITTVSTNPGTLFGFGTWAAFGTGRTIVGIDGTQTEFDTVEETGGAKTHTLVSNEMPSHTHQQDAHTHTQNSHNHIQDAHSHGTVTDGGTTVANGAGNSFATVTSSGATGNVATANATATNQAATAVNQNATAVNQPTGGGAAHNNLQPYIVVYMWKRTA